MSKIKNKSFKVIAGAILISLVSSAIYDALKSKPFLSTVSYIFNSITKWLSSLFGLNLKLWWVLLAIPIYYILKGIFQIEKDPAKPDYFNYTSDRFKDWLWRWEWKWNGSEWVIYHLTASCPKCDIQLLDRSNMLRQNAICPKCNSQWDDSYNRNIEDTEGALLMIKDKVRKHAY
jgi:hypothetical protein